MLLKDYESLPIQTLAGLCSLGMSGFSERLGDLWINPLSMDFHSSFTAALLRCMRYTVATEIKRFYDCSDSLPKDATGRFTPDCLDAFPNTRRTLVMEILSVGFFLKVYGCQLFKTLCQIKKGLVRQLEILGHY